MAVSQKRSFVPGRKRLQSRGVAYLEELYVPHSIVGAIKENPKPGVVLLDEKK